MTDEQREALAAEVEAMFVTVAKTYSLCPKGGSVIITRRQLQLLIIGAAKGFNVLDELRLFTVIDPL